MSKPAGGPKLPPPKQNIDYYIWMNLILT
jgi:hypothetical protein